MGAGDDGETGEERYQPWEEARRPGARVYQNLEGWDTLALIYRRSAMGRGQRWDARDIRLDFHDLHIPH